MLLMDILTIFLKTIVLGIELPFIPYVNYVFPILINLLFVFKLTIAACFIFIFWNQKSIQGVELKTGGDEIKEAEEELAYINS